MIRLTHRERWLIVGIAVLSMTWALYRLGVAPALERIETLKRVIPEKVGELERLRTNALEYATLQYNLERLRTKIVSQEKTLELLPFVESLVAECGLTRNVKVMKPVVTQSETGYQETVVEIEIENLTLRQLCEFLEKIQSPKILASVKRLYIKKNLATPGLLDSQVEVRNLKLT